MNETGIPMDERHKEKNIHFIGASEKVDMMKLVEMAISDIKQCQRYIFMGLWQNLTTLTKLNVLNHQCIKLDSFRDGFITFDAVHQKECLIKCPLDVIVADYNVLSFCCNHLGASAIKYCPRCHVRLNTII